MRSPTIHLNGSSGDYLLEVYETALEALRAAQMALQATAPNGRDYYPQGEDAIREATAEHAARVRKLQEVAHELAEITYEVLEQVRSRARK